MPWSPDAWYELCYPHHLSPIEYCFQALKYPSQCMRHFLAWLAADDTSGFFGLCLKEGILDLCELPWELAKPKVSSGSVAETCSCHPLSKASVTMRLT